MFTESSLETSYFTTELPAMIKTGLSRRQDTLGGVISAQPEPLKAALINCVKFYQAEFDLRPFDDVCFIDSI